jgi:hypothetical protein
MKKPKDRSQAIARVMDLRDAISLLGIIARSIGAECKGLGDAKGYAQMSPAVCTVPRTVTKRFGLPAEAHSHY